MSYFVSVLYDSSCNDICDIIGLYDNERDAVISTFRYIIDNQEKYKLLKNNYEICDDIDTYIKLTTFLNNNQHSDSYGGSPGWRVIIKEFN